MKLSKHNWFKWFKKKLHWQTQTPEQTYKQMQQTHQPEKIERQNIRNKVKKRRPN